MSQNTNEPPHLGSDPALIASYLKSRRASDDQTKPAYHFADFVHDMGNLDFSDDLAIRATLESQIQLLGTAFNYLMLEGDWKYLKSTLKAQKMMRDTMELMHHYPSFYTPPELRKPLETPENNTNNALHVD